MIINFNFINYIKSTEKNIVLIVSITFIVSIFSYLIGVKPHKQYKIILPIEFTDKYIKEEAVHEIENIENQFAKISHLTSGDAIKNIDFLKNNPEFIQKIDSIYLNIIDKDLICIYANTNDEMFIRNLSEKFYQHINENEKIINIKKSMIQDVTTKINELQSFIEELGTIKHTYYTNLTKVETSLTKGEYPLQVYATIIDLKKSKEQHQKKYLELTRNENLVKIQNQNQKSDITRITSSSKYKALLIISLISFLVSSLIFYLYSTYNNK